MKNKTADTDVFDMLQEGLRDSVAFSKGEREGLVTHRVPSPPPPMGAEQVTALRHRLEMSQMRFAAPLNVSPKTVQGWEQGLRRPSNASLRLLQIAQENPQLMRSLVESHPKKVGKQEAAKETMLERELWLANVVTTRDNATIVHHPRLRTYRHDRNQPRQRPMRRLSLRAPSSVRRQRGVSPRQNGVTLL